MRCRTGIDHTSPELKHCPDPVTKIPMDWQMRNNSTGRSASGSEPYFGAPISKGLPTWHGRRMISTRRKGGFEFNRSGKLKRTGSAALQQHRPNPYEKVIRYAGYAAPVFCTTNISGFDKQSTILSYRWR